MFKKGMAYLVSVALFLNMSLFPCDITTSNVNKPSVAYATTVPVVSELTQIEVPDVDVTVRTCLDEEEFVIYDFEDEHDDSMQEELIDEPSPEALKLSEELIKVETDGLDEEDIEEENNIKNLKYNEDDLYILAHIISGEGQYCDETEQKYIGSVFLNRVKSNKFPDTFREVAFQKKQYACTWDGNYKKEPTETNWKIAKWLLENGSVLPSNVVFQAQFKQGVGTYIKTKYHYYCYIND